MTDHPRAYTHSTTLTDAPLSGSCSVQETRDCGSGGCIRVYKFCIRTARVLRVYLASDCNCELHHPRSADLPQRSPKAGGAQVPWYVSIVFLLVNEH